MATNDRVARLSEATCEALQVGGTGLLGNPAALYASLADLAPSLKGELTQLRLVLAMSQDDDVTASLAELGPASTADDVRRVATRIENHLVDGYRFDAAASGSVAKGLAEGVALFHGVKLGGGSPGGKGPGGGASHGPASIPPRELAVKVTTDNLARGWKTTRTLQPMCVDGPGAKPKAMAELPKEKVPIIVPAGTRDGGTITVAGKGYYGPDGTRGDLVVTIAERKASEGGGQLPPAISPRPLVVQVTSSNLAKGWKTYRLLQPMSQRDRWSKPTSMDELPKERVTIEIPAGTKVGDRITVAGKGYYGPNGTRGDLVVEIAEKATESGGGEEAAIPPRPLTIKVRGDLLASGCKRTRTLQPMSVDGPGAKPEAMAELPKESIMIGVPAGTRDGGTITVAGKGYYGPDGTRGDLLVEIEEEPAESSPPRQPSAPEGGCADVFGMVFAIVVMTGIMTGGLLLFGVPPFIGVIPALIVSVWAVFSD